LYPMLSTSVSESSEPTRPHIFLFSIPAVGHVVPLIRIARILVSYNYKVTLCSSVCFFTPANIATIHSSVQILQLQDGLTYDEIKKIGSPPFL